MLHPAAIIPAYNEEVLLPYCIDHLRINGIEDIIVLDNESSDRTAIVAREHGARVVALSSGGRHCAEAIIANIRETIDRLPRTINWILKVDADEFLYSPTGEPLLQFLNKMDEAGFNCIGSLSQHTYPMLDELSSLRA